jgi:hypothetical protein
LSQDLRRLATDDPSTWRELVRGHSDVITSWAVKHNEFFERVEDLVVFRTTRGLLSLPQYLQQSGGDLYYVTRELGSLQEQLLAEGRDVPAIDASWFAVPPFLEKYALRHPDVDVVQLDARPDGFLQSVPGMDVKGDYQVQAIPSVRRAPSEGGLRRRADRGRWAAASA